MPQILDWRLEKFAFWFADRIALGSRQPTQYLIHGALENSWGRCYNKRSLYLMVEALMGDYGEQLSWLLIHTHLEVGLVEVNFAEFLSASQASKQIFSVKQRVLLSFQYRVNVHFEISTHRQGHDRHNWSCERIEFNFWFNGIGTWSCLEKLRSTVWLNVQFNSDVLHAP